MERLSLSRRVEAAVLENEVSRDVFHPDILHIEVPEKGVVQITGFTHTQDAEERLLRVARGVPGVAEVRSEVAVVPLMVE
jgi:osmotically-inducible protein OsmY